MVDPVSGAKTGPFLMTRFGYGGATVSPDGATLAYVGSVNGSDFPLYMQDTVGGAPHVAFPNCDAPAWAPNGKQIACWERNAIPTTMYTLVVVNTDGTGRHPIYGPVPFSAGGEPLAWWPDSSRVVTTDHSSVFSVPAGGGAGPTTLVTSAVGDSIESASVSPDGASLAFVRRTSTPAGRGPAELVVRAVTGGPENPIVQEAPPDYLVAAPSPPQWSADGRRIVFMEVTDDPTVPVLQFRAVIVDSASGGNRKVLLAPDGQLDAVAWGNATLPSYFIKHVEIAQAVSPEITPLPLPGPDPLSATPLQVLWSEPSLDGFAIPLVAGHSTLMRIYVGDASLAPGQTATRQVGYKITGGPSPIQGTSQVTVTAPLDDPNQGVAASAINVWLPPNAAVAGGAGKTFDVEINPGQTETECAGCYPNGNEARLTGVQFVNNGDVTIRPTAITLIDKNGKIPPSPGYNAAFWHDLVRYLPIADNGINLLPDTPPLEIDVRGRTPALDYCDYVGPQVDMDFAAAGGGPFSSRGPALPIAYASPVLKGVACGGATRLSRILILSPDINDLAHEVGHAVGLGHVVAAGPGGLVAAGEVALPYKGLGVWGYERTGTSLTIHDKTITGDLMSYSVARWLSPFSWDGIYKWILAEAPHVVPHPAHGKLARIAQTQSRRLVAGVFAGGTGQIIASIVADAASPAANGRVAGRLLALDAKGHPIAAAAIHGTPADETPGGNHPSLSFLIALPAKLKIAALVLRNDKGKTVAKLRRSKRAPAVRFARLPRNAKANAKLTIRWTTADRDSRMLSVLLYARRGNTGWRLVAATASGNKTATAQVSSLGPGKSLRLRLVVSDGLNTTTAYSKAIKVR